jgi:hypothetical protein
VDHRLMVSGAVRSGGRIHPELGWHLEASITLGVRCSYQPVEPVVWRL